MVVLKGGISLSEYDLWTQENIHLIRFNNVNYFPCYPEMPERAYVNPADPVSLNGRYWELISLLPSVTYDSCTNTESSIELTDTQAFPSGSANYSGSIII